MIKDIINQPTFQHRYSAFISLGKNLEAINAAIDGLNSTIAALSDTSEKWWGEIHRVGFSTTIRLPSCITSEILRMFVANECRTEINRLHNIRANLCRFDEADRTNGEAWAAEREKLPLTSSPEHV